MRWSMKAVIFFSLVCSVLSEASDEPSLKIKTRSSVLFTEVGEKKAIFCEKKNIEEPIEWYSPSEEKVERKTVKNTRIHVDGRKHEPNLAALFIQSTRIGDSGNWTCKAGDYSQTIEIIVGEKVVMPTRSEKLTADEGKVARLSCEAKGSPEPVVQWYFDGAALDENPRKYVMRRKDDTYTLEIRNLTHEDTGEYVCKVTQKALSHYTDKTIRLTVQHKPVLFNYVDRTIYPPPTTSKFRTEEVFAVMNDTKNITCSALATPPPQFRWYRRRNNFDEPIEREEIMQSEDLLSSTLTLRMRSEKDLGEYKCTATNPKGSISVIFDVRPGNKPDTPSEISFEGANSTHLTFNVSCENCTFATDPNDSTGDSENLPVTHYSFELVNYQETYPADWANAMNFEVEITDPEETMFNVGPLPNSTAFHVRVRSMNAAGYSEWLTLPMQPSTTDKSIALVASLVMLLASLLVSTTLSIPLCH